MRGQRASRGGAKGPHGWSARHMRTARSRGQSAWWPFCSYWQFPSGFSLLSVPAVICPQAHFRCDGRGTADPTKDSGPGPGHRATGPPTGAAVQRCVPASGAAGAL